MSDDLITAYTEMIDAFGLDVDKKGRVILAFGGDSQPITVNDKKIVLPLHENLDRKAMLKYVVFHPMCEDVTMRPSLMMRTLVSIANTYYEYQLSNTLVDTLTKIANDKTPSVSNKLTYSNFGSINNNDVGHIRTMVTNVGKKKDAMVRIELENGPSSSHRVCKVRFPLYLEAKRILKEKDSLVINNTKMSKRSIQAFVTSMEHMLGGIRDDAYDGGGDIRGAPSSEALMDSIGLLATNLNDVNRYMKLPHKISTTFYKRRHFKDVDALAMLISSVPPMPGNIGATIKKPESTAVPAKKIRQLNGDISKPARKHKRKKKGKKKRHSNRRMRQSRRDDNRGGNGGNWDNNGGYSDNQSGWDNNNNQNNGNWGNSNNNQNQNQSSGVNWDNALGPRQDPNGNFNWDSNTQNNYSNPWGNDNQNQNNGGWNQNQNQNNGWDNNNQNNGWSNNNQNNGWGNNNNQNNGWGNNGNNNGW